jgi:chromosome segregation ATPase
VTKLDDQLYPVITTNSTNPKEITTHLCAKLEKVLPDIRRAQNEVEQRIKTAEGLMARAPTADDKTLLVKNKLAELHRKLSDISGDYQVLLEMLIGYFKNLVELDRVVEEYNNQTNRVANDIGGVEALIREHEASKQRVLELFNRARNECENVVHRISRQVSRSAFLQKKCDNGTRFLGADSSRRERHPEAPTHPRTEEGQLGESVAAEKGLSGGPETIVSIRHRLAPNQRHARRPL